MTITNIDDARTSTSAPPDHHHVAIIGAGFGGLGAAIKLKDKGFDDLVIFERESEVGGTWWVNTYPGAQCDIPSALYSFSFAPNPNWTRLYPLQEELQAYMRDTAKQFDITRHIQFSTDVLDASWDEGGQVWRIITRDSFGDETLSTATFLIAATGPFSEPSRPNLPGLENFAGATFHSAEWNHDYDVTGKRVAVIGTGASAVQFVPQLQPKVASLTVFQRTATWILPHPDRPVSPAVRTVFKRIPATQRALRGACSLVQEMMVPGLVRRPGLLKPMAAAGRWNLNRQVSDPELRRKLTPPYEFGCKRPTFSNKYFRALAAPNAQVVTDGIVGVTPTGVRTADGVVHEVDAIIFGTGFKLTGNEGFTRIHGRDGRSLTETWGGEELVAYLGTAVSGFPNMAMILGPNSVVYTSQVVTIEAQVDFILAELTAMRDRKIRSLDVTPRAQRAFIEEVDHGLRNSVWNTGGCSSYYLSPSGRNFTFYHKFVFQFQHRMKHIRLQDFTIRIQGSPRSVDENGKALVHG